MNRYPNNSCDHLWVIALTVATLSATAGTLFAQDVAHFVGTNSCAAANCHGGDGSGPRWASSYSDWVQRDKHARAYTVLLNERSRRMVRALGYKQPAHEAVTCLNCHALPPISGEEPAMIGVWPPMACRASRAMDRQACGLPGTFGPTGPGSSSGRRRI